MKDSERYLCFSLDKEEFAIPLLKVKEVIGVPDTTPIPQSPAYFVGLMNLRGSVISILDMRIKLGIKSNNSAEATVVILDLGDLSLGVVVDCVNSVIEIQPEDISFDSMVESVKSAEYISGVFRKNDRLVLLLDIEKAFSVEDRTTTNHSGGSKAA